MLKINKETLNKNLEGFSSLPIKDQYQKSLRVFEALNTANNIEVENILSSTGFKSIYKKAESLFKEESDKGMKLFPQLQSLQIALVYPEASQDSVVNFFEVSQLVNKLTESNLERAIVMGFLMNEYRMIVIQVYNHFTNHISDIIRST